MADSRLRNLQRQWEQSRDVNDEARYLRERLRIGDLSYNRAYFAASAGHPALVEVLGSQPPPKWEELKGEEDDLLLTIAVHACRHYRRFWNLELPIEDPVAWIEGLGGKTHYWADEDHHQLRLQMLLDGEEINSSVPFDVLRTTYPGFNNEDHWIQMLHGMRQRHFDKGKDYILEPLLWEMVDLVDSYRIGKISQKQLIGYASMIIGAAMRTDANWVSSLWGMTQQQNVQENYEVCLTVCLDAKGTLEAINRGVITWALT